MRTATDVCWRLQSDPQRGPAAGFRDAGLQPQDAGVAARRDPAQRPSGRAPVGRIRAPGDGVGVGRLVRRDGLCRRAAPQGARHPTRAWRAAGCVDLDGDGGKCCCCWPLASRLAFPRRSHSAGTCPRSCRASRRTIPSLPCRRWCCSPSCRQRPARFLRGARAASTRFSPCDTSRPAVHHSLATEPRSSRRTTRRWRLPTGAGGVAAGCAGRRRAGDESPNEYEVALIFRLSLPTPPAARRVPRSAARVAAAVFFCELCASVAERLGGSVAEGGRCKLT